MKLSNPKFINRKALSEIYSLLTSDKRIPNIYDDGDCYWVANGYVAFAFEKKEFIFNPELFKSIDMESIVGGFDKADKILTIDSFKKAKHGNRIIAKLEADDGFSIYANKDYLDMFSNDCKFQSAADPLSMIFVTTYYGKLCGVIMPVRNQG